METALGLLKVNVHLGNLSHTQYSWVMLNSSKLALRGPSPQKIPSAPVWLSGGLAAVHITLPKPHAESNQPSLMVPPVTSVSFSHCYLTGSFSFHAQ